MARRADPLQKLRSDRRLLQQELLMFHRVMEGLRRELGYREVLKLVVRSVTEGLGYDRAALFEVDWANRMVSRSVGLNAKGRFEFGTRTKDPIDPKKGFSLFSDLVYGHRPYFYSNQLGRHVTSNASVPIRVGKKVIGILAAGDLRPRRQLTLSDIRSLLNFATQAGLAMGSIQQQERMRSQTLTDGLTGVFNRRYVDRKLPEEIKRCHLRRRPLSLLYGDIDLFKSINDRYGHPAGDEILKRVAHLLGLGLRGADTVARIGGEEFVVLMPETDLEQAAAVARRLVVSVSEDIPPVVGLAKRGEKVTLSLGVACLKASLTLGKASKLLKRADQSLYQAKKAGRNRIGPPLFC